MTTMVFMRWRLLSLMIISLTGCGVSMEDVKQEILPEVEKNTRAVAEVRQTHADSLKNLSTSIDDLQLTVSTIQDKLHDLRTHLMKTLEDQNAHLAKVDALQLDILEETSRHLEEKLKGTKVLISRLREKTIETKPTPKTP